MGSDGSGERKESWFGKDDVPKLNDTSPSTVSQSQIIKSLSEILTESSVVHLTQENEDENSHKIYTSGNDR